MITYVARRLLIAIATIWAISVVAYVIIQLPPGDFVDSYIARLSSSSRRSAVCCVRRVFVT